MTSWIPGFSPDRWTSLPSSTLTLPFTEPVCDAVTGATPLARWKFDRELTDVGDLAFGLTSGSTGETSAALLFLGGLYLVSRNMMNWRIPAGIFAVLYLASVYRGAVRHDLTRVYFPGLNDRLRKARRFDVWAGPLVGLVNWFALASSVVGHRITWRGITYRIRRGGQIRLVRRDDAALADQTDKEQELPAPVTHTYRTYRKAS